MGLSLCLLKILNSSLEHADVVFAGDVFVQSCADTFAVAHLAEDAAVGGGEAFDGEQGAVGVEGGVHGGLALQIHILGSDLAVGQNTVL